MARGIKPGHIRTLDDLKKFPVLTKAEVLKQGEALVSRKYMRKMLHKAVTGGTTGTPSECL